ncbi:MAG: hypothetical protein ACKVIG_10795 [Flavobacteriales bacterium]
MISIVEGKLTINFEQQEWEIRKYDDCQEYKTINQKLDKVKGVDIIGIKNDSKLYLIEIKDFTDNEVVFLERCEYKIDNFTSPLVKKIADSIFGSLNIHRTLTENVDFWKSFNEKFIKQNDLLIVFWLDGNLNAHAPNFSKTQLLLNIKRKLKGIKAHIIITDSSKNNIIRNTNHNYI